MMTTAQICKSLIKASGATQRKIAEQLGMTECALSNKLRRNHLSADMFLQVLDLIGYEVRIAKKDSETDTAISDIV